MPPYPGIGSNSVPGTPRRIGRHRRQDELPLAWWRGCLYNGGAPGTRQSFLPPHLLGLAPLLGCVGPVAGDVKLQDDGMVHHPVDRRCGGHRVGKDAFRLRKDQVLT